MENDRQNILSYLLSVVQISPSGSSVQYHISDASAGATYKHHYIPSSTICVNGFSVTISIPQLSRELITNENCPLSREMHH
jgi:hypothetical protein